jgi:hypothetical protein
MTITTILVIISLCVAAVQPARNEFKNLKVLPRDISTGKLNKIMVDDFEDDLGVSCNFCHAALIGSQKLDYASDEKPEKQIARSMMLMTLRINKKYFKLRRPQLGDSSLVITCNTCHKGQPHPDASAE